MAFLLEKCDAPVILVSNRPYELAVTNICTDVYSMMKEIVSYLESCGKMNIALYGVNPSSANDGIKETLVREYDAHGNAVKEVYTDYMGEVQTVESQFTLTHATIDVPAETIKQLSTLYNVGGF